jgi:POT family proton-dependent oligopeptide transporter
MAFYARVAPLRLNGMLVGAASLSVFIGSVASGSIGGLYGSMDPAAFWALHAAIVGGGGAIIFAIAPGLRRFLATSLHEPAA